METLYIKPKLSLMMFLQFFVWGAWFVTLGTFLANNLQASGSQTGMAFATQSWGAIIAPFIVGLIADRYFNAERILGVLHLIGAALMFVLFSANDFAVFYPAVFAYMIAYMPTLALVNAICFAHLKEPVREFANIRVWGTVGWIVAGLLISFAFAWDSSSAILAGELKNTFLLAAIASALLGLFSFSLPVTPPQEGEGKPSLSAILGLDALKMLKDRNFAVFFVASILICIPLAFYYQNASPFLTEIGVENSTAKMTLGQMSELLLMLLVPIFLTRFGIKLTLMVAMLAWAVRYSLFAMGADGDQLWLLILGIALHGICYDFFFVTGQIYTDSKSTVQSRGAAQGLITLATYGVGMLIGFWIAGKVTDQYTVTGGHDWASIWIVPSVFAILVLIAFSLLFQSTSVGKSDEKPYE